MIQEKLTAAFAYIRVWRAITYTALIIGCAASLIIAIIGLYSGIVAFYSQFGAKSAARVAQKAYVEQCNQNIAEEQNNFKIYADNLPQRLDGIKKKHEQELQAYRNKIQQLSADIQQKVTSYNNHASVADAEFKRLKNLTPNELTSLALPHQDITTRDEYVYYGEQVRGKQALLSQYSNKLQDKITNEYDTYATPLHNKYQEIHKLVNQLQQQMEQLRRDSRNKINELENRKQRIASETFAALPKKNLYGTDDIKELDTIFDISDTIPMFAASLDATEPLTENERRNVRKTMLNHADWLPTYTRTYSPTKEEIARVQQHNADIDAQIAAERTALQNRLNELQPQLNEAERRLHLFKNRKEQIDEKRKQISQLVLATTKKWTITSAIESLLAQVKEPFPSEPEALENKLQREKDLVPQKEKEMQENIRQLQQDIESSKEKLERTLAALSAAERKTCAAVMPMHFGISAIVMAGSWVGFCILLILADYMIVPLLCATKAQETALNTRNKETV